MSERGLRGCVTQAEVRKRVRGLNLNERRRVVCALIGHSRIVEGCFGYVYCGRCGAQIADALAGINSGAAEQVRIGHNCATCRANFKKLTWQDKFLTKNPFTKEPLNDLTIPSGGGGMNHRYTMVAAFSNDFTSVLLLLKPLSHPNVIFRGKWTFPGGLIEPGETDAASAIRELYEETGIIASENSLKLILQLRCNCDPLESEHEIVLFGVKLDDLKPAAGSVEEPVQVFGALPENSMWYLPQLRDLAVMRMSQPN